MKNDTADMARIAHILDAISEIEKFTNEKSIFDFTHNSMLASACIRQLEIIGEASSKISNEIKSQATDLEWRELTGLRNLLIHEYFGVDLQVVWEIIHNDLPRLKEKISKLFPQYH